MSLFKKKKISRYTMAIGILIVTTTLFGNMRDGLFVEEVPVLSDSSNKEKSWFKAEFTTDLLVPFKEHPFKVAADYPMIQLQKSIKRYD